MIEAGANEVDEETMMKAIRAGHEEIQKMLAFINGIVAEIGKPKKSFTPVELDHALLADVYANHLEDVKAAMDTDDKNVRDAAMLPIMDAIAAEHPELTAADLDLISYKLQKKVVRTWLLEDGKRVDGRGINEIRPLAAEVGLLPRVHGSGMFTRGQTQVLTICTLGSTKDAQLHGRPVRHAVQALHPPLQLPAVLRRRGPRTPQPRPPRDRPRQPGRARPDSRPARSGRVPRTPSAASPRFCPPTAPPPRPPSAAPRWP